MGRLLFIFTLLISAGAWAKPFQRVLVLTGGMLEFYTRLGIWSELQESGWVPDLVITTCGSSMLGAIIQSHADPREARAYMRSEDFYNGLVDTTWLENSSGLDAMMRVYLKDQKDEFPHIYGRTIIHVDEASPRTLFSQRFTPHHPRVLMIAARTELGPEAQGAKWSKLGAQPIEEVFLTDDDTASRLPSFLTPMAGWSPRIKPRASAETGWDLWTAARASFSEPYLIAPTPYGGAYYATGAIDLVPVELALELGDDVLVTYVGRMDDAQARSVENFFGFNQNERGYAARSKRSTNLRWIDLSDDDSVNKKYGISPKLPFPVGWLPLPGVFFHIESRMPDTYQEFATRVHSLYLYGAERARDVLSRPRNGDYSYIRKPWK